MVDIAGGQVGEDGGVHFIGKGKEGDEPGASCCHDDLQLGHTFLLVRLHQSAHNKTETKDGGVLVRLGSACHCFRLVQPPLDEGIMHEA